MPVRTRFSKLIVFLGLLLTPGKATPDGSADPLEVTAI